MCTGIRLQAKNNSIVCARTLEFGMEIDSEIVFIPRNYTLNGTAPTKNAGMVWKTLYAAVGANAAHITGIIDGVNEHGVAGGLFYFPDYAQYQAVQEHDMAHTIAPWHLMTWILTTCKSVAEVRAKLPSIKVGHIVFDEWGIVPPLHAVVHDTSGESIVIEYVHSALTIHPNALGVITNSPTFDWHLTNLNNYINISPLNITQKKLGPALLTPLGQGSGMLGLPGDFTSPSRFVRAVAFNSTLAESATEVESLHAAFHTLNLFDIPRGSVQQQENGKTDYEYTQWTSATDLKNRRYYFHTYTSRTIGVIDLVSLQENLATKIFSMKIPEAMHDVSAI